MRKNSCKLQGRILLLNGEGVQVVCMARELHKIGCEVSALCAQKVSSGYATKYLDYKYKCPDPQYDTLGYVRYFYRHLEKYRYDLIIPMGDDSAHILSQEKKKVQALYPSMAKIGRAHV